MKMNLLKTILTTLFFSLSLSVLGQKSSHLGAPKYAPADGEKLLIIGQDLGAVGGLTSHSNGYIDNLNQIPAGVTTYTSIPTLAGLRAQTNWGSGDINSQAYVASEQFDNVAIAIGLYINDQLNLINGGFRDDSIDKLGNWIKEANRPVFLRIGYEFDGPWNGLEPEAFRNAWIYIVRRFDELDVRNVAYVWQSAGINTKSIERWYPGDEYVNWVGYSHFDGPNPGQSITRFAAEHNKPIMIAEATPRKDLKHTDGEALWNNWYSPLFEIISRNTQIKAFAYINANWNEQQMWKNQGWGDSRVEVNDFIKEKWLEETQKSIWLLEDENLFDKLNYQLWQDSVVNVDVVLSLEDDFQQSGIEVYQSENELKIFSKSFPIDQLVVYNLQGQVILEKQLQLSETSIKLPHIKNQLLLLKFNQGKKAFIRKVLYRYD